MSANKIAIVGASGKLGGATLDALLQHSLAPPSSIIALTSSNPESPTWKGLTDKGVEVRQASFDSASSYETALEGVHTFFLVSTPRIHLDFNDAPDGKGREGDHKVAIDAAARAGVKRILYASLAFAFASGAGDRSKAGVMRAHLRTEKYLRDVQGGGKDEKETPLVTVAREGLYNESWPLYLGYFDPAADDRGTVRLAGDGKICWTAISDLGVGNALILVALAKGGSEAAELEGKTLYLSNGPQSARSLAEVAELVGKARGKEVTVEVVKEDEHVRHYAEERGAKDRAAVEWWASTYAALEDGECLVDDPTLGSLLAKVGVKPTAMEDTVAAMVKKA